VKKAIATIIALVLGLGVSGTAWPGEPETQHPGNPANARIVTEDLERFWMAWDAASDISDRSERERIFQALYLAKGTPGLREFLATRIATAERLVKAIDGAPAYYASLRQHTPKAGRIEAPVRKAFAELEALYPDAVFPDVYLLMGRMNAAGAIGESGLLIGFDMHGRTPGAPVNELNAWLQTVLRPPEALPYIVAHELIHFQQTWSAQPTLLEAVFLEGSADFIAELIAGNHINEHVHAWAMPHEREIWQRFAPAMHGTDYTGFLYSGADRDLPEGWPPDVGYFIGYRIAQAYYEQAANKREAVADMLAGTDFDALLERSGYASRFE